MTWRSRQEPRESFQRNPLTLVVFELRFHPVLRIKEGDGLAPFQDSVRGQFPSYRKIEQTRLSVDVAKPGEVAMTQETAHQFATANKSTIVQLTHRTLSAETKQYKTRDEFLPTIAVTLEALEKVYQPIETLRVGLRYQNAIPVQKLSKDLDRPILVTEILSPDFVRVPPELADMDGTNLTAEVRSPMTPPSVGHMTVRYRINQDADGSTCTLDLDRYLDGPIPLAEIRPLLSGFADDLFAMFLAASGPGLREWMTKKTEPQ